MKSTPETEAEFLKIHAVRRFMAHQRKVDDAREMILAAVIDRAKTDDGSLYTAVSDIVGEMPEAQRSLAHATMAKIVDDYRDEIAERAVWPNGNWPKAPEQTTEPVKSAKRTKRVS